MTKASPLPPASTSQTTSAVSSTDEYDATTVTTAKAAAAAAAVAATEPPPPSTEDSHEECVLCCYPLPLKSNEIQYRECCGEVICRGCIIAQRRTLILGTNVKKPIAGSREEELEFMKILSNGHVEEENNVIFVCPFCRAEDPINHKEFLERLWKQIDDHKDPTAMNAMGSLYFEGKKGLSKNLKKAEDLYQQAYDLGYPPAAFNLHELCRSKHVPDEDRMMKYLEEGVKRRNTQCMNKLAIRAAQSGDQEAAKWHFIAAACAGDDAAMSHLMFNYRTPVSVVSKDDLATTLRAHKAVIDKVSSEPREYAIRHEAFEEREIGTN